MFQNILIVCVGNICRSPAAEALLAHKLEGKGLIPIANHADEVKGLTEWLRTNVDYELPLKKLREKERDDLEQQLVSVVEDYFHPEMRRMERMVLLDVVDSAWF